MHRRWLRGSAPRTRILQVALPKALASRRAERCAMRCLYADCTEPALRGRQHCDEHVIRCRDCLRPAIARSLCARCYRARIAVGRLPGGRLCNIEGCDRPGQARGMCSTHYAQWRRTPPDQRHDAPLRRRPHQCSAPGCDRLSRVHDMCRMHDRRSMRASRRPA